MPTLSCASALPRGITRRFSQVEELDFSDIGWTHVDDLAETLSKVSQDNNLKYLWLFDSKIPDKDKAGALRKLQDVVNDDCQIFGLE